MTDLCYELTACMNHMAQLGTAALRPGWLRKAMILALKCRHRTIPTAVKFFPRYTLLMSSLFLYNGMNYMAQLGTAAQIPGGLRKAMILARKCCHRTTRTAQETSLDILC